MNKMFKYKLSDISNVQTGPFGSQLHMRDYVSDGTPIITVEHFGENKIIHKNLPLVSKEDKARLIKYTLREGDVVFSRVGSVDRRVYITSNENGWMFSGRCLRVRPNTNLVNGKFLSYYFGQESFKEYIRIIAVGAIMPSINTKILSDVELSIPNIKDQEAIAEVLSSIDDKIDLLSRNNKTLEELGETIFRKWFVEDIDDTSEVVTLGHLCERITKGTTPTTLGMKFIDSGINFIKAESLNELGGFIKSKFAYISDTTHEVLKRSQIQEGDVLFTIAGTIGRTALVTKDILPANTNQAVAIIKADSNKISNLFIKYLMKSKYIQEVLDSKIVHAVQPNLSLGEISNTTIRLPEKSKLLKFDEVVQGLQNKINNNNISIHRLVSIRDTLLPKLMSGEVRVNN